MPPTDDPLNNQTPNLDDSQAQVPPAAQPSDEPDAAGQPLDVSPAPEAPDTEVSDGTVPSAEPLAPAESDVPEAPAAPDAPSDDDQTPPAPPAEPIVG